MKKIVSLFLLTSFLLCSLTSCIFQDDLAHITEAWIPEDDGNVAVLSHIKNAILLNGEWYDIGLAVDEHISNFYVWNDYIIICINGYDAYGVTRADDVKEVGWFFYRINLLTKNFNTLYSTELFENPGSNDPIAYVNDAVIYINDGVRTITYDTNNRILNELSNENFEEPHRLYPGHCIAPGQKYSYEDRDDTSISINRNVDGKIRNISFDYVADRLEYFDQIRDYWKNIKFKEYKATPEELFAKSRIYILDDKIYIRTNISDKDGDYTSVIIRYDFETDKFYYLYHEYSSGDGMSKVVPVY